ncbi:hypothetical protein ACWOBH_06230 [Globicatella sanguinis]
MVSMKKRLFDILNNNSDVHVAYSDALETALPRINFSLVSHRSLRLSNKRHKQKLVYQVDFFSEVPKDVEVDAELWLLTDALEREGFLTTDWFEVTEVDVEAQSGIYHYWIEVR